MTVIATAYRITKNNSYIIAVCGLGVLMPFIHIFATYVPFNKTEILGFPTLGSFFYSAGWPLMVVSFGFVVRYLRRFALEEATPVFNGFSILLLAVGVYFFMYAIIPMPPKKDLPTWAYYTLLGFCATVLAFVTYRIPDANRKLKSIIRFWMSYLVNDIPKKLPQESAKDYYRELDQKMKESL